MKKQVSRRSAEPIAKCQTGIRGLDEITCGGLPAGRPTLVCGNAGCGKTLMAMEFLVRGAAAFGEPGVFIAFEETGMELAANVASLGFDLNALVARKQLVLDHVHIERSEIEDAGEFDLEGLFVRLKYAIDSIGAKRLVLDTIEALFSGFPNHAILRAELRRLFRWLKTAGVTAVITGERGDGTLTRHGIEEYVSDCVLVLDHRVTDQIGTRRMRIVKYRGSRHGTNEYPFLIDERGICVMPVTSLGLCYAASHERVSTGILRLDAMLGGRGYFRGSSVLVSGTAGTGKTTVAAHFARATCHHGERCLYFLFEESPAQITRNMRSVGIDLEPLVKKRLLAFHASRPTAYGLEAHLATMHKVVNEFQPAVVVIDPISTFSTGANGEEIKSMLVRLIDFLKERGITVLMIDLTRAGGVLERSDTQISSLVDTWLLIRDIESGGERNRALYVLKSRGMAHSNQVREFVLTGRGVELRDVYLGVNGALTGSARLAQEARDAAEKLRVQQELERHRGALRLKRAQLRVQISALQDELAATDRESTVVIEQGRNRRQRELREHQAMERSRHSDTMTHSLESNGHGAAQ